MRRNTLFSALIVISFLSACTEKPKEENTTEQETAISEPAASEEQTEAAEPIAEDTDKYLITQTGVMGFEVAETINLESKNIKESVWESGEGSFPGYALLDDNGEEIGFIFPQYKDETKIDIIQVSSPKYKTKEGLGVGSTLADLKKYFPSMEIHGSEIEGYTSGRAGNISFVLNVNFWSYEIDESQIPDSTEVIEVGLRNMPAPQAAATASAEPEADEASSKEVKHYICFNENNNKDLTIMVSYNAKSEPFQVKYKGMQEALDIVFIDEVNTNEGGASPVLVKRYNELYEGKANGQYVFTHSGIWDYAEYTRGRDGKVFNFTIDHDANPYGSTPCF